MKTKQIFEAYNYKNYESTILPEFCPKCGMKLENRAEGEFSRPYCIKCNFIYYKNPAPAVSVLIINEGKVLLGKRAKGSFIEEKWCLPCGYIEFEEDFLTAAKRECKEETGLEIEVDSIVSVVSNFLSPNVHSLVIVMVAHIRVGEPMPGDDIAELMWLSLEESFPDMAFEADRHIIERYKTNIKELTVDEDYR